MKNKNAIVRQMFEKKKEPFYKTRVFWVIDIKGHFIF